MNVPIDPIPEFPSAYTDAAFVVRGGSGSVYRARDVANQKVVAIKVLDALDRRFQHETDAATRLAGIPGVVPVLGSGSLSDGRPFIVTEFFPLGTIADQLRTGRRFTPSEVRALGCAVASTLASAHSAGVVHCDVKPSNILIAVDGAPMLTDFGIARPVAPTEGVVSNGTLTFTILYSAPEVLGGARPNAASDQYSLAITLATLLLDKQPFMGRSTEGIAGLIEIIRNEGLGDLATHGVPQDLAAIIGRAASIDARHRFSDCAEFAEALTPQG